MNLLSNSCQQTGKKSENGKNGPTHEPRGSWVGPFFPQKFILLGLLRYNLFILVDEMRVKYHRYCVGWVGQARVWVGHGLIARTVSGAPIFF